MRPRCPSRAALRPHNCPAQRTPSPPLRIPARQTARQPWRSAPAWRRPPRPDTRRRPRKAQSPRRIRPRSPPAAPANSGSAAPARAHPARRPALQMRPAHPEARPRSSPSLRFHTGIHRPARPRRRSRPALRGDPAPNGYPAPFRSSPTRIPARCPAPSHLHNRPANRTRWRRLPSARPKRAARHRRTPRG